MISLISLWGGIKLLESSVTPFKDVDSLVVASLYYLIYLFAHLYTSNNLIK